MTVTAVELAAMRRAITISAQGIGTTSPNPPVGCVVLDKDGIAVGEGWHQRRGEAHAEVNALRAAGPRARGATAVVTLEPCNHHGRTPPCRQALLDAGVARVVVALTDPTSRGGGGIAALRAAGVSVEVGALADEALLVLGNWRRSLDRGPQITWIYAVSPAGRPATPPPGSAAALDASLHCRLADVVVREDLTIAQGQQGHLEWQLPSDRVQAGDDLRSLGESGARTIALLGPASLAKQLLRADRIDRLLVYAPPSPPSATPPVAASIPTNFRLDEVFPLPDWTRLTMSRLP